MPLKEKLQRRVKTQIITICTMFHQISRFSILDEEKEETWKRVLNQITVWVENQINK